MPNRPRNGKPFRRPTVYKPDYPQLLEEHMGQGFTFKSFGGVVKVSEQTLYVWAKKHKKFDEARERGQTALELHYLRMGQNIATGKLSVVIAEAPVTDDGMPVLDADGAPVMHRKYAPVKGCANAWGLLARNVCGWNNTTRVEVSGAPEGSPPVKHEHSHRQMTDAEVDARFKELMRKAATEEQ